MLMEGRIAEDDEEEVASPDNMLNSSMHALSGGTDSDEQRSVKSVTKPKASINITDLKEKLSILSRKPESVGPEGAEMGSEAVSPGVGKVAGMDEAATAIESHSVIILVVNIDKAW